MMYFLYQIRKSNKIIKSCKIVYMHIRNNTSLIKSLQNYNIYVKNSYINVFNYVPFKLNKIYRMEYIDTDFKLSITNNIQSNDCFINHINSIQNIEEMFNFLSKNVNSLSHLHCCEAIFQIFRLKKQNSNMENWSLIKSYKINEKLLDMPFFQIILTNLENNLESLNVEEATCLMFCLNHFGVKLSTPIMNNLYIKLYTSIDYMDINCLAQLKHLLIQHVGTGRKMVSKIIKRTCALLKSCKTEQEINSLAVITYNFQSIGNANLLYKPIINKFIRNQTSFSNANFAITLVETLILLNLSNSQSCRIVCKYLIAEIKRLNAEKLIYLNTIISNSNDFRPLNIAINERAEELFRSCNLEQFKYRLSSCISSRKFMKTEFEDKNIEDIYHCLEYSNNETSENSFKLSWSQILIQLNENKDNSLISVLNDVLHYSRTHPSHKLNDTIVNELHYQIEINYNEILKNYIKDFSVVASFLLTFSINYESPLLLDAIYHLQKNYMQLDPYIILSITVSITDCMKNSRNSQIRKNCSYLNMLLNKQCEEILKDNVSLKTLTFLLYTFKKKRDLLRCDLYFNIGMRGGIKALIKQMNTITAYRLASVPNKLQLPEEVSNSIADYTVKHQDILSVKFVLKILLFFYKYGIIPKDFNFTAACINVLKSSNFEIEPRSLLNMAFALNFLDDTDRQLPREIISLKFLEKIEKSNYKESLEYYHNSIEKWKSYCKTFCFYEMGDIFWMPSWESNHFSDQISIKNTSPVRVSLGDTLIKICGSNSVKNETRSVYGHKIDYEFIIGAHGYALPYQSYKDALNSSSISKINARKRMALFYIYSGNIIRNTNSLTGDLVLRRRHLQILGYNVIEILDSNWKIACAKQTSLSYLSECITEVVPTFKRRVGISKSNYKPISI